MAKVVTLGGKEAVVNIRHSPFDGDDPNNRSTAVALAFIDGSESYVAQAHCSPLDHFNKRHGRKLAATRLLSQLKKYPREERAAVFQAICPEYK
jgi:hypothetical protein